jgi:hypothetical protein
MRQGRVGDVAPTYGHHIAVRSAGVGVPRTFDIRPPSFVGRPYAAAVAGWTGVWDCGSVVSSCGKVYAAAVAGWCEFGNAAGLRNFREVASGT